MKRGIKKIKISNQKRIKDRLLAWSQQFDQLIWLDSNQYPQKYTSYECVLAVEAYSSLICNFDGAFNKLSRYRHEVDDFIFGYLSYDLKNDIEDISSNNSDSLDFPELCFFQPKKIFLLKGDELEIKYLKEFENELEADVNAIINWEVILKPVKHHVKIRRRITKKEYIKHLNNVLDHIYRGDIYEMNFCQEFYAENVEINSLEVYKHLNKISTPPFACFLKLKDKYLLSASPERFVRREANKIISQPIKGTAKRLRDKKLDKKLAEQLAKDEKERSENIMIVDLVRNDLSKTALKGSVKVEELCKIYSFEQVHQMISTVTSEVSSNTNSVEIVKSLFPMGSMTGAPKVSAMQIIEKEEIAKRSLYSGAVGYFTPNDDFDFNVVIRSILYNKSKQYLSYSVGGAITAKSDPEKEYEECLIKAIAMKKALKQ